MQKSIIKHNQDFKSLHLKNPFQNETGPLIIMFPAFDGHSEFIMTYGHRMVDQGFQVIIADMFGKGAKFDNLEACFNNLNPLLEDRKLVRELSLANIKAAIEFTEQEIDEIGIMGFCFGGICTLEAARSGLKSRAYFCAHGDLTKDKALKTECNKNANIMLAQGYADPLVEADQLRQFADEMQDTNWSCTFYGNTKHSFTDHNVGAMNQIQELELGREYNALSAEQCFQQAIMFLSNHLC